MAATFPRFSALNVDHFRTVRFSEHMAALSAQLAESRALVEHQCLFAVVLATSVVYLIARVIDSVWVLPLVLPIIVIGASSFQHALALYRFHVRRESLPAICEGIGRLRHAIGHAPDICLDRMVRAGLLPQHGQSMIDDAVYGDYSGHRLSLAMIDLWQTTEEVPLTHQGGDLFRGIVVAISWPEPPAALPADDLMPLVDGTRLIQCSWVEGQLLLAIPCRRSPFHLVGLFARQEQLVMDLFRAASVIQIPHRLIDFMQEKEAQATDAPRHDDSV